MHPCWRNILQTPFRSIQVMQTRHLVLATTTQKRRHEDHVHAHQADQVPILSPPSGATAPEPSKSNVGDSTSELEKIIATKEKGLLTDEEFSAGKAKILGLQTSIT